MKHSLTGKATVDSIYVMEKIGYEQAGSKDLDMTFGALAHPTRRAILARLAKGDLSVGELAQPFAMSQPAISRHLKVLEQAGLISAGSDAQRRPRRLEAGPLVEAGKWLEEYREYWEKSFVRLDELLGDLKAAKKKPRGSIDRRR
jgi:DNA-binding transcriptional ArsR family regulator